MSTNRYRVMLLGRNFVISIGGKPVRHGFYTTRWVEADDPDDAEQKAVLAVKEDEALKSAVLNDRDDPPLLFVEEVAPDDSGRESPGAGYTFFEEDAAAAASLAFGHDFVD